MAAASPPTGLNVTWNLSAWPSVPLPDARADVAFYQAIQPGLDAWGAAVYCGTNFAARASALYEVSELPH